MALSKIVVTCALLLGLAACSASDPTPAADFDGRYVGTRRSGETTTCGVARAEGPASAWIRHGHFAMTLFGPRTELTGTVGEDGTVRASGIWRNPTGGFPGVTVLNGTIRHDTLEASATDFRCHTRLRLHRTMPHHMPAATRRR